MLTLPRSAAAFICMMTITLLTVAGCSNGNGPAAGALTAAIGPPGYQMEAIAGPGKDAAAFRSDYAACERSEGTEKPFFIAACMQLAGNAVLLHNGVVSGPKKQERQEFQAGSCRNFSTNFTDRNEAFTQCMSSLGNAVTRPDGTVIPPHAKFATPLVLVPEAPPAAAPAKVAEAAPSSQTSAADNREAADLLRIFLSTVRLAAMSRQSSSASTSTTTSSPNNDPDLMGSMIGNYASCGDMWGCWGH
ncbi:MAG: hypothetical protein B7Z81_11230 [Acidocella sp. 20-61-6]|nr:MAG: hypothetical protein B7Z81_11230 [Acidocella sp. 20-61-6]